MCLFKVGRWQREHAQRRGSRPTRMWQLCLCSCSFNLGVMWHSLLEEKHLLSLLLLPWSPLPSLCFSFPFTALLVLFFCRSLASEADKPMGTSLHFFDHIVEGGQTTCECRRVVLDASLKMSLGAQCLVPSRYTDLGTF